MSVTCAYKCLPRSICKRVSIAVFFRGDLEVMETQKRVKRWGESEGERVKERERDGERVKERVKERESEVERV